MFRLLRGLLFLSLLAALAVAALTVPLGEKTLWEHLRAIARTEESQELVEGVRETAKEVLRHDDQGEPSRPSREPERPEAEATPTEQQQLRRLIRGKLGDARAGARPSPG